MKILIVDDQRSGRRVLKQMLAALPDVEILEAAGQDEAIAAVERSAPDLPCSTSASPTICAIAAASRSCAASAPPAGRRRR